MLTTKIKCTKIDNGWNSVPKLTKRVCVSRPYHTQLFNLIKWFDSIGAECQKKWINIRDHYNKNKEKPLGTGSSAEMKKRRNEQMAFLDEAVTVNKK